MATEFNPYPVSNSRLTAFKKSPKHLIHYLTERPEPTPAMRFGSAFHMKLLQPELFHEIYTCAPAVDRRSKAGKEIWEQFTTANTNKEILTLDEIERIERMIESVMVDPYAADLINNLTRRESDVEWTDEETGVPMRGIIDGIGTDYIIDVKTCSDASPDKFPRDIINMNYHRQAAIYMDSFNGDRNPVRDFYIVAVESSAPHGVCVHRLTDEVIDEGRKQYRKFLHEYLTWVEIGMPNAGYEYFNLPGINDVYLPNWMKTI